MIWIKIDVTASKIKHPIIGTVILTLYNFGNILSILTKIDMRLSLKVIKMMKRLYLYMFDILNLHQPHFFLSILVTVGSKTIAMFGHFQLSSM